MACPLSGKARSPVASTHVGAFGYLKLDSDSSFCSSIYDDIFYVDNLWWFEKDIRVKGTTNKYLGNIFPNGLIGDWLYEKSTGNFIPAPTYEEYDYTALDTEKLRKMLIKRLTTSYSETRQKRLELGRLNTVGKYKRD